MIFLTLGTQKFSFNRLLRKVDKLIEKGIIKEEVFAQVGYSSYKPKNYKYVKIISNNEFEIYLQKSSFVISHGGIGTLVSGLRHNKKIIAIPRRKKHNEHIDDHQLDICTFFSNKGYILSTVKYPLEECLEKVNDFNSTYVLNEAFNTKIEDNIINYIENI